MSTQKINRNSNHSAEKVKEITDRLEQGIKELFESERYKEYLSVMSKFHHYSLNNTILIAMQKPDASHVAGFTSWVRNFDRTVRKGEKGIRIFAPAPYKRKQEVTKIDPITQKPIMDENGNPVKEIQEFTIQAYRVVNVFDISQTEGKELPRIAAEQLSGSVEQYEDFFRALEKVSPVPIGFENIKGGAHGYYHLTDKRIAIDEGMSQMQTIKTAIHEIAHAKLHDVDLFSEKELQERPDQRTREVQAESVAYTVCQHFGLDTSEYSFGYVAGWSSGKDIKELKESLEVIRIAANELIVEINEYFNEFQQWREEVQEMKEAAHAEGLPFSERAYDNEEEFDPYVFDGSMSIADYELMHRIISENDQEMKKEQQVPEEKVGDDMAKQTSNTVFYTKAEYDYARDVNIFDYLQHIGHPFVQEGTRHFRSKEHSSLVIRKDGAWSWNRHDLNGRNPVTLLSLILQEKYNYEKKEAYVNAVKDLAAFAGYQPELQSAGRKVHTAAEEKPRLIIDQEKILQMPQKAQDFKRAIAYLCQTRKIDYDLVKKLIGEKKIIQEANTNNVGFVAYDEEKQPRHVFLRGTISNSSFKKDAPGSDKKYPFVFGGDEQSQRVYVFEASIDALSHATLAKQCGQEHEKDFRITLNGVTYEGLDYFLKTHPQVNEVVICTDNDPAGEKCAEQITEIYKDTPYQIFRQRPAEGKDWNEYLECETIEREVVIQSLDIGLER